VGTQKPILKDSVLGKKELSSGVKAHLLADPQGTCFNPICNEPLVVTRSGKPIINFEYAHIRDELRPSSPDSDVGWRFWPEDDLTQEQRNSPENIILLCGPCHKLIDKIDPKAYSIALLRQWKVEQGKFAQQIDGVVELISKEPLGTFETKLAAGYIEHTFEIVQKISEKVDEITKSLTPTGAFPIAEFPGFDPKVFKTTSPTYMVIGSRTLSNVGVRIRLYYPDGIQEPHNGKPSFPVLQPGKKEHYWDEKAEYQKVRDFPIDTDKLDRIEIEFWTQDAQFFEVVRYGPFVMLKGSVMVYPKLTEVYRVTDEGQRQLLYRNEMDQLPDGRVYATKDPLDIGI